MGWPMICIETRHAKAAMKAQQVKTDRNDARGLGRMMRTGRYKEVYIEGRYNQELRPLLNNRRCLLTSGGISGEATQSHRLQKRGRNEAAFAPNHYC